MFKVYLEYKKKYFQDTLKNVEQRHVAEVKRLKALQEAGNKLRQEKWMDEKTRRIKVKYSACISGICGSKT